MLVCLIADLGISFNYRVYAAAPLKPTHGAMSQYAIGTHHIIVVGLHTLTSHVFASLLYVNSSVPHC